MTTPQNEFFKAPTDILDYEWNWASWLPAGDYISSVTWTVGSGLTQEVSPAPSNTTTSATVWIGGGTADNPYLLTCEIVTEGGRNAVWSTTIVVQEPLTQPSAPRIITVPESGV